jgi:hypothetical protein
VSSSKNIWARHSAVEAARDILDGRTALIEGCVSLARLGHDLVPNWAGDPDFRIFGVVASDTDHFPIGAARVHWSPAALEREDAKIATYEASVREEVFKAYRNVIARFPLTEASGPDV